MKQYSDFTGLYPLQKTLRFELKPIGKTKENIERNGILERDNQRAVGYKAIKKVIDEYHKAFIDLMLDNFQLELKDGGKSDSLEEYYLLYHLPSADPKRKNDMVKVQEALRKQISERFTKSEQYKRLFGKELIREDLTEFVKTPQYEAIIRSQNGNENLTDGEVRQIQEAVNKDIAQFYDFTTYFVGFYDNRKNMYVADDKATSIAHRMITENLPKFIDNMDVFERIAASDVALHFEALYKAMEPYLNINSIEEMFQLDYFSMVLTQKQIDVYNAIIGGMVMDDGTKIQGLNEYVNLYNQQQKDKNNRLPKLKPLFKQILSERNAISWLPDEFVSDSEMLESIEKCYQDIKCQVFEGDGSLRDLLKNIGEYDLEHIYLPDDLQLTEMAQKHYGNWSLIKKAMEEDVKAKNPQKRNETAEKYEERIEKLLKANESFSLAQINRLMKVYLGDEYKPIGTYFAALGAEDNENGQKPNLFIRIENAHTEANNLLTSAYPEDRKLSQDKANVAKIKNLLDAIKDLQHFVKPLLGKGTESEKDNRFYGEFVPLWEMLDQITPLYNMVRNRMTQKPYSEEKIKLNFDTPTLLNGWPDAQANSGAILKDDKGLYYLAILDSKYRTCLNELESYPVESNEMAIMKYLQGGDMGKNVQNLMRIDGITRKVNGRKEKEGELVGQNVRLENAKNTYLPIEINEIRLKQSYLKSSQSFNKMDLVRYIEYYIPLVREYYSDYQFSFRNPSEYESFVEFTDHINQQAYQVQFDPISKEQLFQMADQGKIYLFQIYNKDFSTNSKGTPNLHTLYWKMLFDERNLADVVYKLNGEAEVFFRKHSIEVEKPTHPANKPIENKNKLNEKKTSVFEYDLVKDRRYTVDKFQFHVPITMNFKSAGLNNINPLVNAYLKESNVTHIIGIDRGERHLLYLSLIDLQGNIVEQYSLNEIVNEYMGNTYRTNYHDLLDAKERQRDEARRSWQTIENIKELKEGYMSQVIHKIAELMVKYNAIVVLEDLNAGFMRGRQKVEKQVYQKFEKMLIDKLNYLVDKKCEVDEVGGVLNAFQLTSAFEGFEKLHRQKQSGFLFYIPAWNTSKMDPTTGFVNLLDTRYENMAKARAFFGKFRSIYYNNAKDWFEFAFDYDDFTTKATGTRTQWTLYTYGTRIETMRNPQNSKQFDSPEVDLTQKFKVLFAKYDIDLMGNLMEQICSQNDVAFFKDLLHLMYLTLQMRNSETKTEVDYLISPVMNKNGEFYDSRVEAKKGKDKNGNWISKLPVDADANGAYNIARKGLWIVEQIKQTDDLTKLKLAIGNKEWMRYAQGLE